MVKARNSKLKTQSSFAKKSLGQNFLIDDGVIEQIIAELDPQPSETIIEIGAGRGALTRHVVESGAQVCAIELDRDLIPILENEFVGCENFQIIKADALQIDFCRIFAKPEIQDQRNRKPAREQGRLADSATAFARASDTDDFKRRHKVVANLPYYISTAILQRLIEQRRCFSELILMLQREVVARIIAAPGNSERGFLSVLIEAYADAEKLFDVSPDAFRPVPKVWSAVVKLKIKNEFWLTDSAETEQLFWQMVSAGFAQKRKTILNNLKNMPFELFKIDPSAMDEILTAAQIDSRRRAETLRLIEWQQLNEILLTRQNSAATV